MKSKCFGRYQNDSLSLPLTCSMRGFFSDNYCEDLIRLLKLKLTMTESSGVFTCQGCLHWASSNLSIIVWIFIPLYWQSQQFLSISTLVSCDSLCSLVSSVRSSDLSYVLCYLIYQEELLMFFQFVEFWFIVRMK